MGTVHGPYERATRRYTGSFDHGSHDSGSSEPDPRFYLHNEVVGNNGEQLVDGKRLLRD